jgi:hypothetical protein
VYTCTVVTDPEVYYHTSGTLNGLHGTIRTENGWDALAAISKFTFGNSRCLLLSLLLFIYFKELVYKKTMQNVFEARLSDQHHNLSAMKYININYFGIFFGGVVNEYGSTALLL